jgi:histidinol phosphatase-like PHP family hydrolase
MFDSHIHTDFSTDSKMKISEAVEASKKAGFKYNNNRAYGFKLSG